MMPNLPALMILSVVGVVVIYILWRWGHGDD